MAQHSDPESFSNENMNQDCLNEYLEVGQSKTFPELLATDVVYCFCVTN